MQDPSIISAPLLMYIGPSVVFKVHASSDAPSSIYMSSLEPITVMLFGISWKETLSFMSEISWRIAASFTDNRSHLWFTIRGVSPVNDIALSPFPCMASVISFNTKRQSFSK